jgi:hypothetical protein
VDSCHELRDWKNGKQDINSETNHNLNFPAVETAGLTLRFVEVKRIYHELKD